MACKCPGKQTIGSKINLIFLIYGSFALVLFDLRRGLRLSRLGDLYATCGNLIA
jgi:hypothetical protein